MIMIVDKNSRYFTGNSYGVCRKSEKLKSPGPWNKIPYWGQKTIKKQEPSR